MLPSIRLLLILHVLLVGFLCFAASNFSLSCTKGEMQALLKFKEGLRDPYNRLSSWVAEDCCTWASVRCNNKTGHVVKLDLQGQLFVTGDLDAHVMASSCLSGEINPSLLELKYLNHLDVSLNCFEGISIPRFIGSFKKLIYLDLSSAGFAGRVPLELGNLSALHHLDLNNDFGMSYPELHVDNLDWLSRLSSLQHLGLGGLNLSMEADWLLSINMLPSLQTLTLNDCNLGAIPRSLAFVNFSMLSSIDLSCNMFGPAIPTWLFNLSKIEHLDLHSNHFKHSNGTPLGNLCNLRTLSLGGNSLGGDMSRLKEGFSGCINKSLEELDLSSNGLSGYLPDWLWLFGNLKTLNLFRNSLSGPIPASLGSMSFLRALYLYSNLLNGTIPESLGKLSNLKFLIMRSNKFEGSIPLQLSLLSKLQVLDLADNNLSGTIPPSFSNFSAMAAANKKKEFIFTGLLGDLESNWLFGKGHQYEYNILSLMMVIDLSNNNLSGEIPEDITRLFGLRTLNLSKNNFTGLIPKMIGQLRRIESLDLSFNQFTGVIPPSFSALTSLRHLNMSYNNLSGRIPLRNQLYSLIDPSIYMENPLLCGPPLLKWCRRDKMSQDDLLPPVTGDGEDRNWSEMQFFYLSMGGGFVVGFWIVWCIFLFKRSWMIAYFHFFDDMRDRLYVAIARKKWPVLRMKMCIGTR